MFGTQGKTLTAGEGVTPRTKHWSLSKGPLKPQSAGLMDTRLWLARSTPELETQLIFSMGQETGQQSTGMVSWEMQPCTMPDKCQRMDRQKCSPSYFSSNHTLAKH